MKTRVLAVTNLTTKFQTTVPSEVRAILGLTNNSNEEKIMWILDSNKIVVKKT